MHTENDEEIRLIVAHTLCQIAKFVLDQDSLVQSSETYKDEHNRLVKLVLSKAENLDV